MRKKRMTFQDREEISRLLSQNVSISEIGRRLGRNKSTVSREVHREGMDMKTYRAFKANMNARGNKSKIGRKRKLDTNKDLRIIVLKWLRCKWSPEQIVERLKLEYPEDKSMRISHETIYRYLYVHPKEKLRRELITNLRRQRKVRKRRKESNYTERRGRIPNMVSIDKRPKEIEDRTIPGHWEGDLILGSWRKSALGTLSERSTRYTILVRLTERDPESVRKAFQIAFKKVPRDLKKTLTYDQGKEMLEHEIFTKATKIRVYFAHKSSPWEGYQ
jgi:IS30 family transposase